MLFHIYKASDYDSRGLHSYDIDEFDTLAKFYERRPYPSAVHLTKHFEHYDVHYFAVSIGSLEELLRINNGEVLLRAPNSDGFDDLDLPIIVIHDDYLD